MFMCRNYFLLLIPAVVVTSDKDFRMHDALPSNNCTEFCGVGTCVQLTEFSLGSCLCIKPYIDLGNDRCSYRAKSKLVTFLLSFFTGGLGVDWFYLSDGYAGYIIAGIFKLITFGGLGLWWLVDWIRILCDSFYDGGGNPLFQDL